MSDDRNFPPVLLDLGELTFEDSSGEIYDFELLQDFLDEEDTQDWFHAWTGNADADASDFLVFAQDGSGGYTALWCVRQEADLTDLPVVFFGSEGELEVCAPNLSDFLWVLADEIAEAAPADDDDAASPFFTFAEEHATTPCRSAAEIRAEAQAEFPDFEAQIDALCR